MAGRVSNQIVEDGLVLYLDAANRLSYVSGSTVWNDLTPNGNNGTLINGPNFDSANLGSIVFDGTNDYGIIPDITGITDFSNTDNYTVSFWFYANSVQNTIINNDNVVLEKWSGNPSIGYPYVFRYFRSNQSIQARVYQGGTSNELSIQISHSNWWNICAVFNWSSSTLNLYGNGAQVTNSTALDLVGDITNPDDLYIMQRGGIINNNNTTGKFSSLKVYNRALSAQEVLQNYNALKWRYGL
jgi:hypothetical protein